MKDSWHGKPLSLVLDHINGIFNDNRKKNLRFLCPNCNSQTVTFAGKKLRNKKTSHLNHTPGGKILTPCLNCSGLKTTRAKQCIKCYRKQRSRSIRPTKINWPPVGELIKMVEKSNFVQVSKALGVSDNAVRKRIKTRS